MMLREKPFLSAFNQRSVVLLTDLFHECFTVLFAGLFPYFLKLRLQVHLRACVYGHRGRLDRWFHDNTFHTIYSS